MTHNEPTKHYGAATGGQRTDRKPGGEPTSGPALNPPSPANPSAVAPPQPPARGGGKRAKKHRGRAPTGRRTYRQIVGQRAEDIAIDFLRARGLQILERNVRRRLGELDIVARDGDTLVIVEVRTRTSDRYGGAAASVDLRKQQRLVRTAAGLLQQRRDLSHLRARFDVVAVDAVGKVDWLRHAFLT